MKNLSKLSWITVIAPVAVVLFVDPVNLYDPFNVLRLLVLTCFGFAAFGYVAFNYKFKFDLKTQKVLYLGPVFALWCLIVLIFSGNNFSQGLFGVSGRNTGFLAYSSLAMLMLGAALSANLATLKYSMLSLLGLAGVTSIYGFFQSVDMDPIDWVNGYSPVFGLFGNPNFHSAFLAIAMSAAAVILVSPKINVKNRILLVLLLVLFLYNVIESKAQQGILAFLVGLSVIGFAYVLSVKKSRILLISYTTIVLVSGVAAVLDILQKSPWTPFLYKASVSERGDVWQAGWRIFLDNPVIGIGLDQYRDYYARYRDIDAVMRAGSKTSSSSAHNIFMDLGSGGGFVLIALYLVILYVTLLSIVRVLRRSTEWNTYFTAVVAAWAAFLAQSIISVGQLGLTVFGWVLTGLIIGYDLNTRDNNSGVTKLKSKKFSLPVLLVGALVGFVIAVQPVINDQQYRTNLRTGNVSDIEKNLSRWPKNVVYMTEMAGKLREANLNDNSYALITAATDFNPNYLEAWKEMLANPKLTPDKKIMVLAMLKKLDPLNPEYK